jgi:hypothetical protein
VYRRVFLVDLVLPSVEEPTTPTNDSNDAPITGQIDVEEFSQDADEITGSINDQ